MISIRHRHWSCALIVGAAVCANVACSAGAGGGETTSAVRNADTSCQPGSGLVGDTCQPCGPLSTPATVNAELVQALLQTAGVQNATYVIQNGVGQLDISQTNLAAFNFKVPPAQAVSLPSVTGKVDGVISFSATATIPSMTMTWGVWQFGASSVTIDALMNGQVDVSVSAIASVNPTLNVTNYPVTITFGADASGKATISSSNVVVGNLSQYSNIQGCGIGGWCNDIVSGFITSNVQSAIQGSLASQLDGALNGPKDTSPFWIGLLEAVANLAPPLSPKLTDPAGNLLPLPNTSSLAGDPSPWVCTGGVGYAGSVIGANFSTTGLCWIDPPVPSCTTSFSCPVSFGFPNLVIQCPSTVDFYTNAGTPSQALAATGTSFSIYTDDPYTMLVDACFRGEGCATFSNYEASATYCGTSGYHPPSSCNGVAKPTRVCSSGGWHCCEDGWNCGLCQ